MDNKLDDQLLFMKFSVDTNNQVTDKPKQDNNELKKKLNKHDFDFSEIKTLLNKFLVQNQTSLPGKIDSPNSQYPTTAVPDNNNSPPLEVGQSTKMGVMWTLKHGISSPKFYEILTIAELKSDTALYLKKFYNHIKMCINLVTRL